MNYNKSHFWYTKSQRNGILFLALTILLCQGALVWLKFHPLHERTTDGLISMEVQQRIDSLRQVKMQDQYEVNMYPFNPSYLTDVKGYKLGMSLEEIDRILLHRKAGNFINSAEEFQQVSKISDSLLAVIQPYFKFPTWLREKTQVRIQKVERPNTMLPPPKVAVTPVRDLNTADTTALRTIRGIGEKLAQRIVNYRAKLGGFFTDSQLYEVYYLDREVADRVLAQFKVLSVPQVAKINLNTASFKEVLAVAYIDYALTVKIFEYRNEIAAYESLEQLKNIEGFPLDKFERIALYLQVK